MYRHAPPMSENDSRFNDAVFDLVREPISNLELQWFNDCGLGYLPLVAESPYDQDYFDRFARQALEPIGQRLMRQRVDFVGQHMRHEMLIDVGIGSGAFVERRNTAAPHSTFGYDINPAGIAWLKRRGLWLNPYHGPVAAVALWDVLEHIRDFRPLLANVRTWLFLALPIFADRQHALRSKHFRPDEHCWYFTRAGLLATMGFLGFELVTESEMEILAGREDIGAFAFKRRAA